ncbi:MAG: hypothetical protein AB7K52_08875 [Phycisphaerales bacterium]
MSTSKTPPAKNPGTGASAGEERAGSVQAGGMADEVLERVARSARGAGVFGDVALAPGRVAAAARDSAEPAFYRVEAAGPGAAAVSLVTPARYLSQSIEADLVHTGDKLDDLLADELIDQGYSGPALRVEHYRDTEKLFTFRSRVELFGADRTPLTSDAAARRLTQILLAYEACFRPLGDMEAGEEE